MKPSSSPRDSAARRVLRLARFHLDNILEAPATIEGRDTVWSALTSERRGEAEHTILGEALRASNLLERPQRWALAPRPGESGLVIVALVADTDSITAPPSQWVAQYAPAWRLHTSADRPTLTLLRFTSDGQMAGHYLSTSSQMGWQFLDRIDLPGAEMLQLQVTSPTSATELPKVAQTDSNGRFSRAEFAFGVASFARWQDSRFAMIGVGRIGSTVAHTLVRQGASVVLVDADRVELHNCDGDVLPVHEGLRKVEAVSRFIRGCARPGARVEGIAMAVADAGFVRYLGDVDAIITTTDNFAARSVVSEIAVRHAIPHLDVGTRILPDGAEADLRLIVPGDGCLHCLGGVGDEATLRRDIAAEAKRSRMINLGFSPRDAEDAVDFRSQRLGSSRAWGISAGHLGLRMLEAMYRGQLRRSLFQRVEEREGRWIVAAQLNEGVRCAHCHTE